MITFVLLLMYGYAAFTIGRIGGGLILLKRMQIKHPEIFREFVKAAKLEA